MMYVMAYLWLNIVVPLDSLLSEDVQPTYVPKRLRWNRTNAVFNTLWLFMCTLGNIVVDYIISIKVDRRYRRKRERMSYPEADNSI